MLMPPKSIASLVSVSSGEFVISGSATNEQKKEFDEWLLKIKKAENESELIVVYL